jgi:hypothetical protein
MIFQLNHLTTQLFDYIVSERKPNKRCEYKGLVPNYGSEDFKLSAISIQFSAKH